MMQANFFEDGRLSNFLNFIEKFGVVNIQHSREVFGVDFKSGVFAVFLVCIGCDCLNIPVNSLNLKWNMCMDAEDVIRTALKDRVSSNPYRSSSAVYVTS